MLIPVILSGGAGSRLWPVSREGHPKPFMKLADGETLLLKTYRRAASVATGGEVVTVTNRDYFFMSKDEFTRAHLGDALSPSYLLEPAGRNTAPAVAMAAFHVQERHGADAVMLILAADHLIADRDLFAGAVRDAHALASDNRLVTFGIEPTGPETGFGYIECGEAQGSGRRALRFVEKPSLELAREYVGSGRYLWNSGMFCFKAGVILEELARHAPDVHARAQACWDAMAVDRDAKGAMIDLPAEPFGQLPDISVDYAVMERSDRVSVVPGRFGWNDIGSWNAISSLVPPDEHNNRCAGDAILVDSRNTFVQSEDRLVAAVGVDGLMIVDTPDALLVARQDAAQDVKKVVAALKLRNHDAYKLHRTVARPWGTYTVLEEGPNFKIKRIEVRPGASLSLQMHHHRSEHWIVVSGAAKVVNGEQDIFLRTNESTFIPAGHKHRLENPGKLPLVLIEVQSGDYLGEDDIVRFQDVYGRC
ncbi:mannose-1-phosphate guanylyltransferase/mannose-6-phosphate isomerase [Caldimonas caldifontis]|jgi:mannose-1-phosphate guanylyltransferase / mannose-6-phosphate isomerase|uniref:mannose-1-phosphate guanylyltransferase n=1 Tax=Caldimonas caldifontis TaxID=1452508 RepID=A0A2S5SX36_9BURK|nr:mannose-1-phosphate guanylyltransferase/mannose-6-phosphate isomerase [Caldimonas caldifontis]PPE67325.1 mannose-1-phosphate guanylyltransferase/mannose-6-phosphate isomerase [Caldimonas caldifontis]